jgi:rRNA maturation endonuclease Nob1
MFCSKFTDGQRASAMQMVSKPDEEGVVMTPDLAVQNVAKANGVTPQQKSPRGCPMK